MIKEIKPHKIMIMGLQGSGKTYYSKQVVKKNNYVTLVYSPHYHDFKDEGDEFIFFKYDDFVKDFEDFCIYAKELGKKNLIDGVFIDEFDLLVRNNYDIKQNATDLFINHRHYNLFIIAISRRPQDIPAKIFESSKYIVCFTLQGENVKNKFNNLYKGFGDLILNLSYDKHDYIFKEIGHPPQHCPKI